MNAKQRNKIGTVTSVVGIICNTMLSFFKIFVGALSCNVSVIADGVNNISDVGTAGVAFLSFQLAKKPESKNHPFGYARVEYIASLIISMLIFFVAYELISTSINNIFSPKALKISAWIVVVLVVSLFVKIGMFVFYKLVSNKEKSMVIQAMALDSICDVVTTSTVLLAYIISRYTGFNLDGYIGIAVSLFIVYSGIKILISSFSSLLGEKPSDKLINFICSKIRSYPQILGIHDLVIHTYGFGKVYATIDAEMDGRLDLVSGHEIVDKIERDFYKSGINLVIHMDPILLDDKKTHKYRKEALKIVQEMDESFKIHDFRIRASDKTYLYFDIDVPTECKMSDRAIINQVVKIYKMYNKNIVLNIKIDRNSLPIKKCQS